MIEQRHHIDTTTSTNNLLKELSRAKSLAKGYIVSTDFQNQGRGQAGNSWESEKGKNLLFSMLIYPHTIKIMEQFLISQVTSLAIKAVLDKHTNDITIKWPNDIYWKDKKIAGILIENTLFKDRIDKSILGIGININQEEFLSDAPNPISLKQITGKEINRETILLEIQQEILSLYKNLDADLIRKSYFSQLYRKQGYYNFLDVEKKELFSAKIERVENDGRLVLLTKENIERGYYFKEVEYK